MKRWIKRKVVADKLGVSYNYLRNDLEPRADFPKPIALSPKVIVFEESQIETWMNKTETPELQLQPVNA